MMAMNWKMKMPMVRSINLDIRFEDFFVAPQQKKAPRKTWKDEMDLNENEKDQEMIEEEEEPIQKSSLFDEENESEQNQKLSSYERQQKQMEKTIQQLEQENMAQKSWTLKGEASSKVRPMNSLLEEDLEFETNAKPAPIITEETTQTLTDLITQRIKDEAWDDVVRKAPPKDSVFDPNRRFELQDEKSSKSLAQIYEEEYQKKTSKTEQPTEKSLALQKQHDEITDLFKDICQKLDALSNYHYVPKEATMELEVIPSANVPAISMEEVIPATVSDAMLAAPKEVYDGKAHKSQEEMDADDRRKARVKAKRAVAKDRKERERAKALLAKETGTEAEMTKEKAMKKLMNQSNVTIISDKKDPKANKRTKANVIEKGGKVQKEKQVYQPSMLKL